MVNDPEDHSMDVRCRIEHARSAFIETSHLVCIQIRKRYHLVQCYIFSILYVIEARALRYILCIRLVALEIWIYRRLLKTSPPDIISNNSALPMMQKRLEPLTTVIRRKLQYLGHDLRSTLCRKSCGKKTLL